MESAMPYETRQTMEFFKKSGGTAKQMGETAKSGQGAGGTGNFPQMAASGESPMGMSISGDNDMTRTEGRGGALTMPAGADMSKFRDETEQQLEKHKQRSDR